MFRAKNILLVVQLLFFSNSIFAQTSILEDLLHENKISEARKEWNKQVAICRKQYPDSLQSYIPILGRIVIQEKATDPATRELEIFAKEAAEISTQKLVQIKAQMYLAEFYGRISQYNKAYFTYLIADQLAAEHRKDDYNLRGKIQNNLATIASRLNDIGLNAEHQSKAEMLISKAKSPDFNILYLIYNSKGSVFYYAYQLDSGAFYYKKALEMLEKSDRMSFEKQYSKAVVFNNLAGIYNLQGNNTAAIEAMQETISNLTKYINDKQATEKKEEAREFLYEAMDNLAGIYKSIGDYSKALHLLNYAFNGKLKNLPPTADAIFKSEILLGQLYYAIKDYGKARKFLHSGLAKIPKDEPGYYFWLADGNYTLALLHDVCEEIQAAQQYFEMADSIYQLALQGSFDNIYLGLLNHKALFYAENQNLPKAIAVAKRVIAYTQEQNAQGSLQSFHNKVNLANIYFKAKNFNQTLSTANESISIATQLLKNSSGSLLDSVGLEQQLTKAILLKAKAEFELLKTKDFSSISIILAELQRAKSIYDRRKILLSHEDDIGFVNSDYREMTDFINKLQLLLYASTQKEKVLEEMLGLHESVIYQKIRSHLHQQKELTFFGIPTAVQKKEKALQEDISNSLKGDKKDLNSLDDFFAAEKKWQQFQLELKQKYPNYYKTKYENKVEFSFRELAQKIPDSVTVIRFFEIDLQWYALVVDKSQHFWIQLNSARLEEKISALADAKNDEKRTSSLAHQLYLDLWQPLAEKVKNKRVMIIPEGVLYYLSFDMLSSKLVKDYKSLRKSALLNSYAFSYHYSLLAIEAPKNKAHLKGFSGFVPLFSDKEKAMYMQALDSSATTYDNSYLSLLPLPFSEEVAKKAKRSFGGELYSGTSSTKEAFIGNAGKHAIIHLGTHAESNDEYPEYSRLIFAKNPKSPSKDNSLYLYDIYQYDMSSNITVLTACETGRPGFFPGEGMISMAHAFNFAGSKSILTGLWKIDEQSSAQILAHFYKFLQQGLPKDVALQQAKIAYLENAEGRMIDPQYWAGLVLMGDVSAIENQNSPFLKWIIVFCSSAVLILVAFYFLRRRK